MKTILKLTLIFCSISLFGQRDLDQKFSFYVTNQYNESFNVGVNVDYQMNFLYFSIGTSVTPSQNRWDLYATPIGFNIHLKKHRIYTGTLLGVIRRHNYANPTAGFTFGYDLKLQNLIIGSGINYQYRSDFEFFEPGKNPWSGSPYVKLGFKF